MKIYWNKENNSKNLIGQRVKELRTEKQLSQKAVEAGKAGLESTRNIVATKGRAMRLGERAIGHLDPGAASAAEILEVFYKDMPN